MQKVLLLFLSIIMLSCSASDESQEMKFDTSIFPQEWELVETSSSLNGMNANSDLQYRETIVLKADNSFLKRRIENNDTIEAVGSYKFTDSGNLTVLILTHSTNNVIIENCSSGLTEYFNLNSSSNFSGGAIACDGAGLFYERIK